MRRMANASPISAALTTVKAAAPANEPFILLTAIVKANSAVARPVRPLESSSSFMLPSTDMALAINISPADMASMPSPMPSMFFGMNRSAMVTAVRAKPSETRPAARTSAGNDPNFSTADANIIIAAPSSIKPAPVEIRFLPFPTNLVNARICPRTTSSAIRPAFSAPESIVPNASTALARIRTASAMAIKPAPVLTSTDPSFEAARNNARVAHAATTPAMPLMS